MNMDDLLGAVICRKCGAAVSPKDLGCRMCLSEQSRQAYLDHQLQYLPDFLAGRVPLTFTRVGNHRWHVVQIGDRRHAWCGQEVSPQWDRRQVRYQEILFTEHNAYSVPLVCTQCCEVFEQLRERIAE